MISLALSVAQAISGPPIVVPRAARRTSPEVAVTRPALDLDCSLIDASMRRFALVIEQRGGRGYIDPRADDPGKAVRSTGLSFRVVKDETGLFAGGKPTGSTSSGSVDTVEAQHPEFGISRLRTFPTGRGLNVAAIVYVDASAHQWTGMVRYSGFCSVTRHEQVPLTEAEAIDYVTR